MLTRELFLHCLYNHWQTGKHSKSTIGYPKQRSELEHSSKHTHGPVQKNVIIISPTGKSGKLNKDYLVLVNLKHDHNHPVHAGHAGIVNALLLGQENQQVSHVDTKLW